MKGTGGSAFPTTPDNETRMNGNGGTGMTLRDYFAGQVLAGLMALEAIEHFEPKDIARLAYENADAMIAERAKS